MAPNSKLSVKGKPVNFSIQIKNLFDVIASSDTGTVELLLSDQKTTFAVRLSPRTIALFLWQALSFRTAKMISTLELNRTAFSAALSETIKRVVASRSFANMNEAWNYDAEWPDFEIQMAEKKFMNTFRICAYFKMDDIRCRLGPSYIQICQRILVEDIPSYTEYRRKRLGESREEYISEISEGDGDFQVEAPIFTLNLSYNDLSNIILYMAKQKLNLGHDYTGQWCDVFATLVMLLTRLPDKTNEKNTKKFRGEVKRILFGRGIGNRVHLPQLADSKRPRLRRITENFSRPLSGWYEGINPYPI